ncbi:MAG TPA: hypothetical protein VLC98_14970 [Phnomibacter sp.]|nr:hypothetical protein [Phnomibacter sp.]
MTHSIVIEFQYGLESLDPLFDFEDELKQLVEANNEGRVDGHEIAMDDSDGRIYIYANDANTVMRLIEPALPKYSFLKGARITLHFGNEDDSLSEEEIIGADGKRELLPITDMRRLSPFPEWDQIAARDNLEEGDEWKASIKNESAEKLYNQWQHVYLLLEAISDSLPSLDENPTEEPTVIEMTEEEFDEGLFPVSDEYVHQLVENMLEDGMIIPAKISGAESGGMYMLRMENAAIIRHTANDIFLQCSNLKMMGVIDEQEVDAVRREMELFRELFRNWVSGFEKDDFEDEWGLF